MTRPLAANGFGPLRTKTLRQMITLTQLEAVFQDPQRGSDNCFTKRHLRLMVSVTR